MKMLQQTAWQCRKALCTALLLIWSLNPTAAAGSDSSSTADPLWWKHAVFYEIYPRSFADTNNDGIGDLKGIQHKLDYLKNLGVNAIWITPCYPSPQVDFGYDVSDYEDIDPIYGTLKEFDQLERKARKRGIRIILDLVLNHTSDQHKWFLDSRSSRTSVHRDWYIWRDGRRPGEPPNNWLSIFGGSAWKFDSLTGQYYYHRFYPQQPDLNWRNPAVENAMFDVTKWWYKRGVAGFRLDAVSNLFEDPALRDNPILPGSTFGDPRMEDRFNDNLPEVHEALRQLRKVADEYHGVLVGETWADTPEELDQYHGKAGDELQMPMDLAFTKIPNLSAAEFRSHIEAVNAAAGWPVYVIGNHDIVRSSTRYGDGKHDDQIAKLMAAMYLTLRGTPIMYYGEEIGMENNDPVRKQDVKDPVGQVRWPFDKGRDGERTPMQWDGSSNAGFTHGHPWLPIPPSYKTHNVAVEEKDPNSILEFYTRLLALRSHSPALLDGDFDSINPDDPNVLAYLRRTTSQVVLVVLNMSASSQNFRFAPRGLAYRSAHLLLGATSLSSTPDLSGFLLPPFGAYIFEIEK